MDRELSVSQECDSAAKNIANVVSLGDDRYMHIAMHASLSRAPGFVQKGFTGLV
jgi:hypothetical protein